MDQDKLKARGERNKAKRDAINKKKREKMASPEFQAKLAEKKQEDLNAIHNVKKESEKARKTREKFSPKSQASIGTSSNNKKWEKKRKDRYNQKVWRGWRNSDGEKHEVVTYKLEDLKKNGLK